ncbi:hypothetical protein [Haemophilus quentini]|nr:hypothetical protein [Haemophilus quentini]
MTLIEQIKQFLDNQTYTQREIAAQPGVNPGALSVKRSNITTTNNVR